MARETIFQSATASLYYHPELRAVHHEIHAFIKGADLQNLLNKGLELFQKRGASKWLSDDRKNGALTPEDEQWAKTVWFPKVLKAGWKHWALVLPQKVVGQMNLKRFQDEYAAAGIKAHAFATPEEALKWLANP